ncbi:MAG: phosphoenolpyruvate carboxykinase domain-containing protein, partial [Gammaproteobacteria bacterium]
YGENMRALKWVVDRCRGRARGVESPLGWVPPFEELVLDGIEFSRDRFYEIMNIDRERARQEANDQEELFTRFGDHLPREMEIERELLLSRLYHSPTVWDLGSASAT